MPVYSLTCIISDHGDASAHGKREMIQGRASLSAYIHMSLDTRSARSTSKGLLHHRTCREFPGRFEYRARATIGRLWWRILRHFLTSVPKLYLTMITTCDCGPVYESSLCWPGACLYCPKNPHLRLKPFAQRFILSATSLCPSTSKTSLTGAILTAHAHGAKRYRCRLLRGQ